VRGRLKERGRGGGWGVEVRGGEGGGGALELVCRENY